jgi:LssY C-terminus
VNFVLVGSEQQVKAALDAANWHVADTDNKEAVLKAVLETYQKKDYLQMPMSQLYLFGRRQDYGYELAEAYSVVASRHHFRIWKAPFTWNGQTVWVGAGTHDIGFEKDQRNGSVTHKIDPAVDGERDNIGSTLQKSGKAKSLSYYLPPDPVQGAKNATGGGYHSDGRILVVQLQ